MPAPRRRRTPLKRVFLSLLVMTVMVIVGAGMAALWGLKAVQAPGPLSQPTNVVIEFGQRTPEIAALLERSGVVADHRLFVLTTYLTRSSGGDIKAGEYEFPAGASLAQVLSIIRSGRAVVHRVTVPEGWTSAQVVERVKAHPALSGTVSEVPPEGSLLPDTYVFQRGLEREVLIARMRDAQASLVDDLWEQRDPDLPIRTKEEAVILASIVEKETAVAEERQQVAAVFINRLRKNMRLQSDPTIIYGIVGGQGRLDRPLRRSDIDATTPYNTYRIDGLPPTPIANPGREAIAAVLQPGTTDHLYFVADGTGGHAFARTLGEHNENVRRWRIIEREARDARQVQDAQEAQEAQDAQDAQEAQVAQDDERPTMAAAEAGDSAGEEALAAAKDVDPPASPESGQSGGEDRIEDVVAEAVDAEEAANAEETAGPEAATEAPANSPSGEPHSDTAVPVPQVRPQSAGPVATLGVGVIPIPKPKPPRN